MQIKLLIPLLLLLLLVICWNFSQPIRNIVKSQINSYKHTVLKKNAINGDIADKREFGKFLLHTYDEQKGLALLTELAQLGDNESLQILFNNYNSVSSIEPLLVKLAADNNTIAQVNLANYYYSYLLNIKEPIDYNKRIYELYSTASELGSNEAKDSLIFSYVLGDIIEQDFVKAYSLLNETDNKYMQLLLAKLTLYGLGTKRDITSAINLMERIESTSPYFPVELGKLYIINSQDNSTALVRGCSYIYPYRNFTRAIIFSKYCNTTLSTDEKLTVKNTFLSLYNNKVVREISDKQDEMQPLSSNPEIMSQYERILLNANDNYNNEEYYEAIELYNSAQNNLDLASLGNKYITQRSIPINNGLGKSYLALEQYDIAYKHFTTSAYLGNKEAQYFLGYLHSHDLININNSNNETISCAWYYVSNYSPEEILGCNNNLTNEQQYLVQKYISIIFSINTLVEDLLNNNSSL